MCALLVGACVDGSTKEKRTTVDPETGMMTSAPSMVSRAKPSEPAANTGTPRWGNTSPDERPVPSCETANPEAPRYREIRLRGEAPHLGALSEPGFFNIIIIGAEWCVPCGLVRQEIPKWLSAYPGVVFTYVDIVGKGLAVSRYSRQNEIETIPYAYLSNECGYGLSWLRSDLELGQPLDVKIALKLRSIFGPPQDSEGEPVPMVEPKILSMAAPRASMEPGHDTLASPPGTGTAPSAPKPPTEPCHEGNIACAEKQSPPKGARGAKSSYGRNRRRRAQPPPRGGRVRKPGRPARNR